MQSITVIILAKNEQQMLENCLRTVKWADQILVLDNGSTDETARIAEDFGARVISFSHSSFARLRNEPLKHIETDWVFYLDPDERVTPTLAKEILVNLETDQADILSFNRKNICYGQVFEHGGWENDVVTRAFKKTALQEWQGDIHESPVYEGRQILLHTPLIHLTHRNTTDGLKKTVQWTAIEARLLYEAGVSKVSFLTLVRKGLMEFLRRAVFKKGYKDGLPGLIEAVVQGINRVLVYIQVWELQQEPDLEDQYRQHELKITRQWSQADLDQFVN
ncbi:MAG: glycosyltransferase [Candidatus Pacebacteria bacterium]|nr:glycosyltransferase [Candidatus Paceibacterota bacterium]